MNFLASLDLAIASCDVEKTQLARDMAKILRTVRVEYTKALGEAEVNKRDAEQFRILCEYPEELVALYNAFIENNYGPTLIGYARQTVCEPFEVDSNAPSH